MIIKFDVYWQDKCRLTIYRTMQNGTIRRDFEADDLEACSKLAAEWLELDPDELYKKLSED